MLANVTGTSSSFTRHSLSVLPCVSTERINFSPAEIRSTEVTCGPIIPELVQAHGILMILAWPMLALTAIFFATWMRPALPNGEWFQVTSPPPLSFFSLPLHKPHSLRCTEPSCWAHCSLELLDSFSSLSLSRTEMAWLISFMWVGCVWPFLGVWFSCLLYNAMGISFLIYCCDRVGIWPTLSLESPSWPYTLPTWVTIMAFLIRGSINLQNCIICHCNFNNSRSARNVTFCL